MQWLVFNKPAIKKGFYFLFLHKNNAIPMSLILLKTKNNKVQIRLEF